MAIGIDTVRRTRVLSALILIWSLLMAKSIALPTTYVSTAVSHSAAISQSAAAVTALDQRSEPAWQLLTEHYPPYQIDAEHGSAITLVSALLQETPFAHDLRINVLPWSRAYHSALHRPNTLLFSVLKTAERSNEFIWLMPLCQHRVALYRAANNNQLGDVHDLTSSRPWRIGAAREQATISLLKHYGFIENDNLLIVDSSSQVLAMMEKQRVDLVVASEAYINYLAVHQRLPVALSKLFTIAELGGDLYLVASQHSNASDIAQLLAAQQRLEKKGSWRCQLPSSP